MIVFFDTNVLVSAVATRGLCADVVNAAIVEHQVVVGETVLAELRQVCQQKLRLPASLIDELIAFLRLHARVVTATRAPDHDIRDPNDRAIIAEAVTSQADVLVTGDQELLRMAAPGRLRVVSPRGFWELLRAP